MRDPDGMFADCWSQRDTGDLDGGRHEVHVLVGPSLFRGCTGLRRTKTVSRRLANVTS